MRYLGELGINWHGLLGQFVSFGILLALLIIIGYKPITKMLDERSQRIKESMDQAEFNLVAQAEQIGERLKEEARQQAKKDAEAIVARARSEIKAENEEAIAQLRKEFVEVAIQAAEKVINRALDMEAHRQLIEETLRESTDLKEKG
jgi:F-type H+-transporting ATPase subunit b